MSASIGVPVVWRQVLQRHRRLSTSASEQVSKYVERFNKFATNPQKHISSMGGVSNNCISQISQHFRHTKRLLNSASESATLRHHLKSSTSETVSPAIPRRVVHQQVHLNQPALQHRKCFQPALARIGKYFGVHERLTVQKLVSSTSASMTPQPGASEIRSTSAVSTSTSASEIRKLHLSQAYSGCERISRVRHGVFFRRVRGQTSALKHGVRQRYPLVVITSASQALSTRKCVKSASTSASQKVHQQAPQSQQMRRHPMALQQITEVVKAEYQRLTHGCASTSAKNPASTSASMVHQQSAQPNQQSTTQ